MKAVLCYNDNENEKLRTTIRITIPKNWKGIAVPKVHNLLQEFITPYNAHYKNKNILTIDNVYLAVQKDDIPTTPSSKSSGGGGFFRNRKTHRTNDTKNNQLQNMDSFDSLDARYIPLDPDASLSSCIKNNITVYVLHTMKATLHVPSPKSKSKSTTTITNTKNINKKNTSTTTNRKYKTRNERILAAYTNETDTVDYEHNTTMNDDTCTDAGESYQDMHSSYSSGSLRSLRDDSLDGSYIEPDNDNDNDDHDDDEARDDVEDGGGGGEVEPCSNLSVVKANDLTTLVPPMRQKLSIFSAIVTNRQNNRDCDGSVSSIPSRLGWMNRTNSIIKNDLQIARARPNNNNGRKHLSSDNRSVTSFNTDRSNLYVHNLFRKLRKQPVGNDNTIVTNTNLDDDSVLVVPTNNGKTTTTTTATTTATTTVVEPYLQSHQVLTRTESMKKRVSFGRDTYAFDTIKEEETITRNTELSSNDDDDDDNNNDNDNAANNNNRNHQKVTSTSASIAHKNNDGDDDDDDDVADDDDDDDANEIFSCGDDYVNVTPVVPPVVSDGVMNAIKKNSSNEENECNPNDSMDNNSIAKDLKYLTTLLDNLKPHKKGSSKNNKNKGGQQSKQSLLTHDEILLQSKKNLKNSSNSNYNSNSSTNSRDVLVLRKPNKATTTTAAVVTTTTTTTTATKAKTKTSSVALQQNSLRQSSIAGISDSISDGEDEYIQNQQYQKHNKSSSDLVALRNTLVRLDIMPDCDLFDTVTNDLLYHHQQNLKGNKKVTKNDLYNVVAREMKQRIETSILLMLAEYHNDALARENYNAKNNISGIRNGRKGKHGGGRGCSNSIEEEDDEDDDDDEATRRKSSSNEEDNAVMVNPHFYDRSVQKLRNSTTLNNDISSSSHTYATRSNSNKSRKNHSTTNTTTNSITVDTTKRGSLNLLEMHNSTKQPPKIQQSIQFRDTITTEAIVVAPSSSQSVFQSLFCSAE